MTTASRRSLAALLSSPEKSVVFRHCWIWLSQLSIFVASGIAAFLLRFDLGIPRSERQHLELAIMIWLVTKSLAFRLLKLHHGWWQYVSVPDMLRIGTANVIGSLMGAVGILLVGAPGFPRSIYLLDLLICFLGTSGIRIVVRMVIEAAAQLRQAETGKRILIYGAGTAGQMLARETRSNSQLLYELCGFVDDDRNKSNGLFQGARLLGSGRDLTRLVREHRIDEVLIAIPSATGPQMAGILGHCHAASVRCKTIPGMVELAENRSLGAQIRHVAVEDLLGRRPVRLDENQIRGTIEGQVVLVTGAAGSIGSELCRQVARFRPAGIVGFEIAESPLFEIDREMLQAFPRTPFYPEIGNIRDRTRLDEVLLQYSPSVVYHAAAYKHVPMMEAHAFEAIENNVFGTYNLAVAASEHGVEDFVMISSDKAVRPTNVMGATKRVAELLLLGLQNGPTKYVAVRFGNVLGSSGSVIPIFKQQIAAGGPVTVTHPEMRRYFMTIPEASQLVLQASTMGHGGEIFVLDMGTPVKIVDLARNLILLSGLRPDQDIAIEFTGVRPGEKLFEELNSIEENTLPTPHEKIKIFAGNRVPSADMEPYLEALRDICTRRDVLGLVLFLKDLIPDYNPSARLLNLGKHPVNTGIDFPKYQPR